MKTPHLLATGLSLAWPFLLASSAFGQGDLNPPPGPPAPTMKSLDQVEPRTIVNAANTPGDATNSFIIIAPGSYYLTGNITGTPGTHGISIQANDVTLDLNGFALISGGGAGVRGVNVPVAQSGFSVRNGSVRGWTGGGVRADTAVTLAEKLRLSDNVGATGLAVGNGSMIKDCVASGNATGFFAPDRTQVSNCIATVNTGVGFDCGNFVNILDCTASRNGESGILVGASSSVIRCSASRNIPLGGSFGGHGIHAGADCTIADCTAGSNTDVGISAESGSVTNSTANNNTFGIATQNGTVMNCTANYNVNGGISAFKGSVTNSSASHNADRGIYATEGTVTNSTANSNAGVGIFAPDGTVTNSTANSNAGVGIVASDGTVTNSTANSNGEVGIVGNDGIVTNSTARRNGQHGIEAHYGVVAFCVAADNDQDNLGYTEIYAFSVTRTGNNPTP